MNRWTLLLAMLLAGCRDDPPQPSFKPLFPPVTGELLSRSSPALADLDRDGTPDIVFGIGVERLQPGAREYVLPSDSSVTGYVVAVSGADSHVLWKVPHPRDAFTLPRFLDVNGDGVVDVIMGGREGCLAAYSGVDGKPLWRADRARIATTRFPYNFFTPAIIGDRNDDGTADLLVVYAGDDSRLPNAPRDPGFLVVISGKDGSVLAKQQTPDRKESYSSVVVYQRSNGEEWFVFGTGGETDGGSAFRAPVTSLFTGDFAQRVEQLTAPGTKGVIAPATLFRLNDDDEPDLAISTFDGRLIVVDGASGKTMWERRHEGEETYHQPAVARIARDGRPGLLLSRGIGVFPRYTGTIHRLYDAKDGRQLIEYKDTFYPAGAPLAVDLTGDGIDEPIFFSFRFPAALGGRIYIMHGPSTQLLKYDVPSNFGSTPVIADPRKSGKLELIGLGWYPTDRPDPITKQALEWGLLRLDLSAPAPKVMAWSAYMGPASDGKYSGQ